MLLSTILAACVYSFSFNLVVFRRAMVEIFPEGLSPNETEVTIYVSGSLEISVSSEKPMPSLVLL